MCRLCLIALAVTGCASDPPRLPPAADETWDRMDSEAAQELVALFDSPRFDSAPFDSLGATGWAENPREAYKILASQPPAESRSLRIRLDSQAFDYYEDGELLLTGPIASGKSGSATPTGRFAVLSKDKDKVSSLYTNEIGTQAWMPYSLQFYGNYFVHEGWLPGYPASHGCVRLGHYHAKLLFERMRIGDPVTVSY